MSTEFNWPKKGMKAFAPTNGKGAYFHMPSVRSFHPTHSRYRHGVELNLKAIIKVGIGLEFFKKEDVEDDLKWHNLAKLWNHAKKLLLQRWSTADPAPLYATESVINDLHQSDPNGQTFRYESDKDGKPHKYEKLPDQIGVAQLKKTMDGVFNFLEGSCSGLQEDLQALYEMRADWEAEMRSNYDNSW